MENKKITHGFCSPIPKRCLLPQNPALPIFKTGKSGQSNTHLYIGTFNGYNVTVKNHDNMTDLYKMGYFGKGSLSSSYPSYDKRTKIETEADTLEVYADNHNKNNQATSLLENEKQNITETSVLKECLHLMLEEAFFISYALECLDIYNDDGIMDNQNMWSSFQSVQPNFIGRYVAYHYFRAKGWVVKSGVKFGGDFILYKQGPPFYHSSFIVIVVSNINGEHEKQEYDTFLIHYRTMEVIKKELMICQVIVPQDFVKENVDHLKLCNVSEFLLKRWITAQNRELK